jgi:hypothetical protein
LVYVCPSGSPVRTMISVGAIPFTSKSYHQFHHKVSYSKKERDGGTHDDLAHSAEDYLRSRLV